VPRRLRWYRLPTPRYTDPLTTGKSSNCSLTFQQKFTTGFFLSDVYTISNILSNIIPPSTANNFFFILSEYFLLLFSYYSQTNCIKLTPVTNSASSSSKFTCWNNLYIFFFVKPHKFKITTCELCRKKPSIFRNYSATCFGPQGLLFGSFKKLKR
jgi:hypothetical protein